MNQVFPFQIDITKRKKKGIRTKQNGNNVESNSNLSTINKKKGTYKNTLINLTNTENSQLFSKDVNQINFEPSPSSDIIQNSDNFQFTINSSIQIENEGKKIRNPKLQQKFYKKKQLIEQKLLERDYVLTKYISEGGEGIIFEGFLKSENDEGLVFKVIFDETKENYNEEIDIMRLFERQIHIINLKESIECEEDKVYVHVLEKCKYSLSAWLKLVKQKQIVVTPEILITLVFNLVDGLIQMRIYKIYHLDIKPDNILITQTGSIVYSDFGISMRQDSQQIIKGFSKKYAPHEQQDKGMHGTDIDFQVDVYSLGKTFREIFDICKNVKHQGEEMIFLINELELITNYMIINQPSERIDCLSLHQKIFQIFEESRFHQFPQFLRNYQENLKQFNKLANFDKNKDISYYLNLKKYYTLKLLQIQNFIHNDQEHIDIATTLQMLGIVYCDLGDIIIGVNYEEESLRMRRSLLKSQDLSQEKKNQYEKQISLLLNSIGVSHLRLGNYLIALKYLNESLEQWKQKEKVDTVWISRPLNNLGCTYSRLGDYFIALQFKLESLEFRKKFYAKNHILVAIALNSVGIEYSKIGDIQSSFKYLYEAYQMRTLLLDKNHPDISQSLHCIGRTFGKLGDYQKNFEYQLEALNMRKEIYKGQQHPDIAQSLNSVAICYCQLGDQQNALKYAFESLKMNKGFLLSSKKEISHDIAENLETIASIYNEMGDSKRALQYGINSLEIKRALFKGDNSEVAKTLNCIGNIYKKLGLFQEAIHYYENSLSIRISIFKGINHPSVASSLFNIGTCYGSLQNPETALMFLKQSLQMRIKIFSFYSYPDLGHSYYEKGCAYHDRSYSQFRDIKTQKLDLMKAIFNIRRSYKILNKYFQGVHPLIEKSLNRLGIIYFELDRLEDAKDCFLRSMKMRELLYKGLQFDIIKSMDNLNCYYYQQRENITFCSFEQVDLLRAQYDNGFIQNSSKINQTLNQTTDMTSQFLSYRGLQNQRVQQTPTILHISKIFNNHQIAEDDSKFLLEESTPKKLMIRDDNCNQTGQIDSQRNKQQCKDNHTETEAVKDISTNPKTQKIINIIEQHTGDFLQLFMDKVTPQKESMRQRNSNKINQLRCYQDKLNKSEQSLSQRTYNYQNTSTEKKTVITFTNRYQTKKQLYNQIEVTKEDSKRIFQQIDGQKRSFQQCDSKNEIKTFNVIISSNNVYSCESFNNQGNIQFDFSLPIEDEMPSQIALQQFLKQSKFSQVKSNYSKTFTLLITPNSTNTLQYMRQQPDQQIDIQCDIPFKDKATLDLFSQLLPMDQMNQQITIKQYSPTNTQVNSEISNIEDSTKVTIHKRFYCCQIPKQMKIEILYCLQQNKSQKVNYFEKFKESELTNLFLRHQQLIEKKLNEKKYYILDYISQGGEGVILEGYKQHSPDKIETVVFKIIFPKKKEDFDDEINILRLFEKKTNIVEYKDSLEIRQNTIYAIVLEKCVSSLQTELETITTFSSNQLFQMIFDLLDGLIQLRVYQILHLDIKPENILKSKEGVYLFTDFGISSIKKLDSKIQIKGYTKNFASIEQLKSDPNTDFSADVYSLGRTFEEIFKVYKLINEDDDNILLVEVLQNIVKEQMINPEKKKRENCLELHKLIFEKIVPSMNESFLTNYVLKINNIINLYQYDMNKDVPYYLKLKIYYFKVLLNVQTAIYKTDHEEIANTHQTIGLNYCELGYPQKGLEHELKALKIRTSLQCKEMDPLIAGLLNSIGCSYRRLGDYINSLKYGEQSLKMRRQQFSGHHVDVAKTLNNVAFIQNILGNFEIALEYMQESLKMRKALYQTDHSLISTILNSIGTYYCDLGDTEIADVYLQESFQMLKRLYSVSLLHPDIALAYHSLGSNQCALGYYEAAIEYELKSIQMYETIFKKDHPDLADSLNSICSYYLYMGSYETALNYGQRSLNMLRNIFYSCFDRNPAVALCFSQISMCYCELGQYELAIRNAEESLQIRTNLFGKQHTLVADTLSNFGHIYCSSNKIEEAIKIQQQSMNMQKQFYKRNHPKIAQILFDLGFSYRKIADFKTALFFFKDSLKMRKKILIKSHPEITKTLIQISYCYEELGKHRFALLYRLSVYLRRTQIKSKFIID